MIPMTSAGISETAVHVDTMVYDPDLPTRVNISETVVHGSDMTAKSAAMEAPTVEPAMEATAMPSTAMPSAFARVGETWRAEDRHAQ
jgi:hypothetical protein